MFCVAPWCLPPLRPSLLWAAGRWVGAASQSVRGVQEGAGNYPEPVAKAS